MANALDTMGTNAVPLLPATGFTIQQQTTSTAVDVATIRAATSGTGDYLVLQNASQTERFVVEDGGNVVITQAAAADVGLKILRASTPTGHALKIADNGDGTTKQFVVTKNYNILPRVYTTRPTTGLVKGELLVLFHNSLPKIGICNSTAGQTIRMINVRMKTFGRRTVASLS
jgi:hypothetical protein